MQIKTVMLAVLLIVVFMCLFLVVACKKNLAHKDSEPERGGPAAAVQTTTHRGVGTVKGMDMKAPSIEIDHEDIEGLMPAMQMQFAVKDASLMNGISIGDKIEFIVENSITGLKIVAIRKV